MEYALELARGWGAEVTVYHVANAAELASYKAYSMEDLLNKHRKTLGQFLNDNFAELLPLVEVRQKVEIGSPATNILEEAEREGSDLIVMSTHGRTGLAHMLMGSVTEQVVRMIHPRPRNLWPELHGLPRHHARQPDGRAPAGRRA